MKTKEPRRVIRLVEPEPVTEGAGVKLRRSIASRALDYVDPFLLLDDFRSHDPADFIAGFPMHPHRGIETVTYLLDGLVRHRDSLGNAGEITAGDVQWMTAGRGILHEEMPQRHNGVLEGFQLWVNLPAKDKMMRPRYQDVPAARIPEVERLMGFTSASSPGRWMACLGRLQTSSPIRCFWMSLYRHIAALCRSSSGGTLHSPTSSKGQGRSASRTTKQGHPSPPRSLPFSTMEIFSKCRPAMEVYAFLLIAGKPLREPIARYGPFVMNTQAEIRQTLKELREGTFPPV